MKPPAMQDGLTACPGTVSLLDFVSFPVAATPRITEEWADSHTFGRGRHYASTPFYVFGAADALAVSFASDLDSAAIVRKRYRQSGSDGFTSNSLHLGLVSATYPGPFSLQHAVAAAPLIGCITTKMREDAWGKVLASLDGPGSIDLVTTRLLREAMAKTSEDCGVPLTGFHAAVILSFDSEDITVLLFSRSFRFIKRFTTNFRTLDFADIVGQHEHKQTFKHVLASTNTVMGVSIQRKWRNRERLISHGHLHLKERLCWHTYVQTNPGHMQCVVNTIRRAPGGRRLVTAPVAGRNDLFVHPRSQALCSLQDFLTAHTKLIQALQADPSAHSTETVIAFPDLTGNESSRPPAGPPHRHIGAKAIISDTLRTVQKDSSLHEFERQAFTAILRKLIILADDCYMQDSFATTATTSVAGITSYLSYSPRQRLGMTASLDTWIAFLELSHASRYTGSPPVGETAVSPTLGQYMSGQKVLTLYDGIANRSVLSFQNHLPPGYFDYSAVSSLYANCFTTTCIPFEKMRNYFIAVPYGIVMDPVIALVAFCHELGHVLFSCFLAGKKVSKFITLDSVPAQNRLVDALTSYDELSAELFCAKVLHDADFTRHAKNVDQMFTRMQFGDPSVRRKHFNRKQEHISGAKALSKGRFVVPANRRTKEVIKAWVDVVMSWDDPIVGCIRAAANAENKARGFWELWAQVKADKFPSLGHKPIN